MPVAFRAVHAQWGTVFAHLPDLGRGQAWEAVWKVRPSAPLTCDECGHPMHAKVSVMACGSSPTPRAHLTARFPLRRSLTTC
jgi:hypothetical protein